MASVYRLKPYEYIHVLDNNLNTTGLVVGPANFTAGTHEEVVEGPSPMIQIPPAHYIQIGNPVVRGTKACCGSARPAYPAPEATPGSAGPP